MEQAPRVLSQVLSRLWPPSGRRRFRLNSRELCSLICFSAKSVLRQSVNWETDLTGVILFLGAQLLQG